MVSLKNQPELTINKFMKKLFNLFAGLVLAGGLVANAATPSLKPIKTLQAERTDEIRALTEGAAMLNSGGKALEKPMKAERVSRLTEMSQLPAATEKEKADQAVMLKALSMKKAPSRAGAVKTGTMISADFSINGRPYVTIMTLEPDGDTYIMKNIYGLASTEQGSDASVKVTVNAQAGTVSIKPGKIYTHEKYGQVWMVSYDPEANTISSRKEITGYINEKGEIQLGPWVVAVPTGEYRGRMFNAFTQSYWGPQNATVKTELINSKDGFKLAEYPALFRQLNANQVMNINARHAAAQILYNGSDDANNVRENITLASDPDLTWTASEHFTISGDQASSVKLGKGWLKCTADGGKLEKTIEVTVTALSSIDDIIEDGREVSERVIYDLSGRQVINPIAGTVYVVRTIFKDGGSKTEKKVYIED